MDSALRASPLRGALRASVGRCAASDELTRAIPGPRPAGALRASKTAVLPFCRCAVRYTGRTDKRKPRFRGFALHWWRWRESSICLQALYLSHSDRSRANCYTHIYTQAGCAGRSAEMYS